MAEIHINEVKKAFEKVVAVNNVELTIHDHEFMVLLGPSGCGKTTLLRCLAGLENVDQGRIFIKGEDITDYPPRSRHISMVFQSYAIFPHLSIFENIAFGLRMQHLPKTEINKRVNSAAELLQIENLLDRYPAQISGGQRQRVAVARAITVQAEVLLMDEPLSNLDALLRLEMRAELKRLIKELQTTVVYVTHDQVEALSLGDRIAIMKNGVLLQVDKPLVIYDHPATEFIGSFMGNPPMNFLPAVIDDSGIHVEGTTLTLDLLPKEFKRSGSTQNIKIGIRAENIKILPSSVKNAFMGKILVVEPLGSNNLLTVIVGNKQIKVNTYPYELFNTGDEIWLQMRGDKISWMDFETGNMLV